MHIPLERNWETELRTHLLIVIFSFLELLINKSNSDVRKEPWFVRITGRFQGSVFVFISMSFGRYLFSMDRLAVMII